MMWTTILGWLSGAWAKIVMVGAALAGLFVTYETIKGSGETEQVNADLKKGLQDVETSQQVSKTIAATSDADVHTELYDKYSRSN